MPDVEDGQYQTVGDHTSTVGHTSQCGEAVTHYSMLADMLVELSLAVRNPQFDPAVEYSEAVKITKPERLFSMDETRLTNDTTEKNKSKANRSLVGAHSDRREVIVNKGGGDGTGIGGSSADLKDLPGLFIFAKNIIHVGEQDNLVYRVQHPPTICLMDQMSAAAIALNADAESL